MIRCIAIDDEPKALEVIRYHIARVPFLVLEKVFLDAYEAIRYLDTHSVDLIFLDINMPDLTGLQFARALPKKPLLIFTTAHSEYALDSYEVEAVDYLLKPFDFSRFLKAAYKVKDRFSQAVAAGNNFFFLKTGNQQQRIFFHDIYYLQAEGNYISYITKKGNFLARASLKESLEALPASGFVQIHRSFVVALRNIEKVENNHVYTGKEQIAIGTTYRDAFLKILEASPGNT